MPKPLNQLTPQDLAYLAGRGSTATDAQHADARAGDRIAAAAQRIAHPDAPVARDEPRGDADALGLAETSPAGLAYIAGRGSHAELERLQQDEWGDRIVAAASASEGIFGEITDHAYEDGDKIVFDQRGGYEVEYGEED